MGYRSQNNYDAAEREGWRKLPWRERYDWWVVAIKSPLCWRRLRRGCWSGLGRDAKSGNSASQKKGRGLARPSQSISTIIAGTFRVDNDVNAIRSRGLQIDRSQLARTAICLGLEVHLLAFY
jgi:hypothetical protein